MLSRPATPRLTSLNLPFYLQSPTHPSPSLRAHLPSSPSPKPCTCWSLCLVPFPQLLLNSVGLFLLHLTRNSSKIACTEKTILTENSKAGVASGPAGVRAQALQPGLQASVPPSTCSNVEAATSGLAPPQVHGQETRVPSLSQCSQQESLSGITSGPILEPITLVRKRL